MLWLILLRNYLLYWNHLSFYLYINLIAGDLQKRLIPTTNYCYDILIEYFIMYSGLALPFFFYKAYVCIVETINKNIMYATTFYA